MTEKRFTKYVPDSYGYTYITTIIDNENNKQTGNIDEIIDMLNELDEKYVDEFSLRETLQQELQRVEEENKQLKEHIKDLRLSVLDSIHEADKIQCSCNPCVVEVCVKRVVE